MKAIMFDTFGGPDVLHVTDVDRPEPGPGQVRVAVRAAGVNPIDAKIRSGAMQPVFTTKLPKVPGLDVAGVVDAVGDGVTSPAIGQRVVGWSDGPIGSYAEYTLASDLAPMPDKLSFTDAVTLPTAVEAAKRALNLLGVEAGDTLLVSGAAGSVGTIAVQMAIARGATVVGTAGEANQDYIRSLGAIPTTYGNGLVDRVRALVPGVDAVLDVAGKGVLPDAIALRGSTDRILTLADGSASKFGVQFSGGTRSDRSTSDLAEWVDRAARGEVVTAIVGPFPLDRAADAQRATESGHSRGKVVLTVDGAA